MLKKCSSLILISLSLLLFAAQISVAEESATLKDGISSVNAITVAATLAYTQGEVMDKNTISVNGSEVSVDTDNFHLVVHTGSQSNADRVTISARSLNEDTAKTMGIIFGMILSRMGGMSMEDCETILSSIDFDAFNTMRANTQTLIQNGYKIIATVAPDDLYCYQLSLAILSTGKEEKATSLNEAEQILLQMNAQTSAQFLFDENTDQNKVLGQPNQYYSKISFALSSIDLNAKPIPGLSVNQGGSIEVFPTRMDAVNRQQKIQTNLISFFGSYEYSFVCENALLRLSPDINPDEMGDLIVAFVKACTHSTDNQVLP